MNEAPTDGANAQNVPRTTRPTSKTEETTVATKHRKPASDPGSAAAMTSDELLEISPFDGDLTEELAARPPRRVRPGPTLYLGAGVLLVAGFLGGLQAQKHWGTQSSGSNGSAAAPRQAAAAGAGGQSGQSGRFPGGAGTGNVTFGTVKLVDGKTIYLQTATGGVVQVTTNGSTKVQVSKTGTVTDLKPGGAVTIQGAAGADGKITATSVNQGGFPTGNGSSGGGGGG